jgi:NAD(P)-dependent dehydrogenase (short-subunit alcohol dehydrogenase family)
MAEFHQTVVITGAGSGLGAALARRYAAAGWRVAVTDQDAGRAAGTLEQIVTAGGPGSEASFAMRLDVRDEGDWEALEAEVMNRWGGLEQLISNAGVATAGTVVDTPQQDWDWVLDINLLGVVRGCRRFAALMQKQGRGQLVNMASFAGLAGVPGVSSYGVAKAGVVALSEALRAELHASGVRVSVVCPAFVQTRLTETMRSTEAGTREQVERWMKRSPVSAAALADHVFRDVGAGKFLILTHRETRWAWRLKRWLPERYFRVLLKSLP